MNCARCEHPQFMKTKGKKKKKRGYKYHIKIRHFDVKLCVITNVMKTWGKKRGRMETLTTIPTSQTANQHDC